MDLEEKIIKLKIDLLEPSKYLSRKSFDERSINELATTIKEYGIINPLIVRKINDTKYEIISGERRYQAAKKIGLTELPVIIKNIDPKRLKEISLIENITKENINPIEEAEAYDEIIKSRNIEKNELEKLIGKSTSLIENKIKLLSLPIEIKNALKDKKISEKHAKLLMNLEDENLQINLLNRIIKEKLSIKELENIIKEETLTKEDIEKTIEEIMKTLKVDEPNEQKEEKESEKDMNNGNFFPNYNNQVNNSGTSLNTMNMQSMNLNQMPSTYPSNNNQFVGYASAQPNMADNNINQLNNGYQQNINNNQNYQPNNGMQDQPIFTNIGNVLNQQPNNNQNLYNMNVPNFEQNQQFQPNQPINSFQQTPDFPLFDSGIDLQNTSQVEKQPSEYPEIEQVNIIPDFLNQQPSESLDNNSQNIMPALEETAAQINIPVLEETPTSTELPVPEDKLTKITNLLNELNVSYKTYKNDTGNCIIIEI